MKDCIFCKIVKGEIPSYKILEDKKHIAFLSIYPNTPGFTVVATKEHKPSYVFDNNNKTIIDLILFTKKVSMLLDKSFDDVARTGIIFEGFGVDHLHSKLFPMHGTVNIKKWKPIKSKIPNLFFKKYQGYLSSHDSNRADDVKLMKIAKKIRETVKYNK